MRATLTNYQQSPRKVRLVADMIRGKSVPRARMLLSFADKKSAPAVLKLLESAVSSARSEGASAENLFIKDIQVNMGISMKRFMPMARGQAHKYRHRRATVILMLDAKKDAIKTAKKTPKKN
ncbi:50S ribosomal protein L22 [Candidatus Kaiserbacteria bacterium]|nr:50S ribosomal protein L22 [Candidatus Kaiserbacteria bacterium]